MYLDGIYEREYVEKKDIRFDKNQREYISHLLAELAYNIYMEYGEGNPVFTKYEALKYFRTCMKNNGFTIDIIDILQIITQLNILEAVPNNEEEKYRFVHSNYQLYFLGLSAKM
jgi:hypothetical protein